MAHLEEMYAYFKDKESQDGINGKSYNAISVQWVLDSGASHHMTNNAYILQNLVKLPKPIFITTANKVTVMVEEARAIVVSPEIILKNAL